MKHRVICIITSCLLVLSLLPYTAYAEVEVDMQPPVAVQSDDSGELTDGSGTEENVSSQAAAGEESPEGAVTPADELMEQEEGLPAEEDDSTLPAEEPAAQSPDAGTVEPQEEEPEESAAPIDIEQEQAKINGVVDKTYTGKPVEQDKNTITVTLGETVLQEKTDENPDGDYTISYENNEDAGEAFVVVEGQGDYTGTLRAAFTIAPRDLSKATVTSVSSQSYTGKAIKPAPAVTLSGTTLKNGTDYKLSYKNNKAVGKATLTITGIKNYKGTITKTFKITDKTAKKITVSSLKCSFKVKAYVNYRLPYAARPTNLYLTARKGGVMELKWTDCKKAGAAIDGYIILRKTKPSDTYTEIKRVSAKTVTYTDKTKKKNNQMYYYAIVGYQKNSDGTFTVSPARNAGGVTYESKSSNPYSVTINYKTLSLYKGQTKTLKLSFSKYKKVCSVWTRWNSSDTSVVTVDKTGKVKAVGAGKATIYARTANGRKVSCVVTVSAKPPYLRVAELAKKEVGYKGTGSGSYSNRFSKYAKELDAMGDIYNTPKNGYDWCDIFADWCYIKILGKEKAIKAINQPKYGCGAGCYFSAGYYKQMGRFSQTPSVGSQIFFDWDGDKREDHTGIVVKFDSKYVYTVEGNTGGGTGQVKERQYERTYKCITGYGKPKW